MPEQFTKIKVFVASPGDVPKERQQLDEVIREINTTIGRERNISLDLTKWETHCYPAMGRPQGEINKQIGTYDIFIGIMWKRFGTPTGKAESGTEEEFRHAYRTWQESTVPHIMFYFNKTPFMSADKKEHEQFGKVLEFRSELSEKGLVWEYENVNEFANIVRPHLVQLLSDKFKIVSNKSKHILHQNWDNLDSYLQDSFALAYNQSRRDGSNKIRTSTLFAAMLKLNIEPLNELFTLLPRKSLPDPISGNDKTKDYILDEKPDLSGCVRDSLEKIGPQASIDKKLTTKDIFVDIAKHGTGSSVRRLRTHGITANMIDEIVTQLGWGVIGR